MAMGSELLLITFQLLMDMFQKYRYCLLVYKNPFLEIHPDTGGGQHIPAGLPYPPLKILEQGLITHNPMPLKYYIT